MFNPMCFLCSTIHKMIDENSKRNRELYGARLYVVCLHIA